MKLTIENIRRLLVALKAVIHDEHRCTDDPDDETPGMTVTVATSDGKAWGYQTGDNSYSGGCYLYHHWHVLYLYRTSDCRSLAREAVAELRDLVAEEKEYAKERGGYA